MENLELRDGLAILRLADKSRVSFDATDIPALAAIIAHLKPTKKLRRTKEQIAAEKAEALANGEAVAKALIAKNAAAPVRQHVLNARAITNY